MPAGSNRPPITATAWMKYVTEVVTRYKGRINNYQIWNEPVDKRFYSGELSEMATITKIAYTIIKKLDPNAKVLSPPFQPRKQARWSTKGKTLLKELKSAGYPFDIYTMHIYPQKGEGIEGFVRDCKLIQNAIVTCPKKPLWITEFNYNLGGTGNPYPIAQQNKLIAETEKACKMLGIPRVFWYAYQYNNPALIAITNT
jgi:GH35 family endo-1,4-beta-xylanase